MSGQRLRPPSLRVGRGAGVSSLGAGRALRLAVGAPFARWRPAALRAGPFEV
jgi:hypothetical protein